MKRADLSAEIRRRLVRLPPPFQAHYGVVPLPPPVEPISVREVDDRHQAAMKALAKAATVERLPVIDRLLARHEAVASLAIEGIETSLEEVLALEDSGGAEGSPAGRQALAYARALEREIPRAIALGRRIFTRELLQGLHRAVVADDAAYEDLPGAFRERVVWVGGRAIEHSIWNPPPPAAVEECIDQTLAYLRDDDDMSATSQSLVTCMAIAHAHFEAVHPFRDGNGRVGRLLLPLMMAADGYAPLYLSPFIERRRSGYFASLRAAQQRLDWSSAIGFIADAIVDTVEGLAVTILELLETDLAVRRGAIKPLEHGLVAHAVELAGDIDVDLDKPLDPNDE